MKDRPSCCSEPPAPGPPWRRRETWILLLPACLWIMAGLWEPLGTFPGHLREYFAQIAPALLAGLLIGGVIDRYVPREYIAAVLSSRRRGEIGRAVLLGLVMSACSHGILALAMELHRKGASTPTVVAFLLASPWANLPITFILLALFGIKALYIIGGAVLVALITGHAFRALEKRGYVESNPATPELPEGFSIRKDLARRYRERRWDRRTAIEDLRRILSGAASLAGMVLFWITLGMTLSALTATLLPASFLQSYLGPDAAGMASTLGLATVLEVCSECTAPLALELFRQTGAFGNAFIFLMAGVVTDYTEIGLLWSRVGRKSAIAVPLLAVPQVILLGWLANTVFITNVN
ncbi:MAG: hypothetical protein MOGMAGMI_00563 [Candidatus Omnitrophica bacterium]|nr:hypothetical protein [Candidatus Omnitrophota bacterium]